MCGAPFDPIRESLALRGSTAPWLLLGTCIELALLGLSLWRERKTRAKGCDTRPGTPLDPTEVKVPSPWLELAAVGIPIASFMVVWMGSSARDPRRLHDWLAQDALATVRLALFVAPSLSLALLLLAVSFTQRRRTRENLLALGVRTAESEATHLSMGHQESNGGRLVSAALVVVFGGIMPFAVAVLTYTRVVFPLPENWRMDDTWFAGVSFAHRELSSQAYFWLRPTVLLAALAFAIGAALVMPPAKKAVGSGSNIAEAGASGTHVPLPFCIIAGILALPLTTWLVVDSIGLAREIGAPIPYEFDWRSGSQAPLPEAPEGEGFDLLANAPILEYRTNGGSIDGTELPKANLALFLRSKRQLWLQINPGKAYPGHLVLAGPETAPAQEVLDRLWVAREEGYIHAMLMLKHCVRENRPLFGPFTGCRTTGVGLELGPQQPREPRQCLQVKPSEPYGAFARRAFEARREGHGVLSICGLDDLERR